MKKIIFTIFLFATIVFSVAADKPGLRNGRLYVANDTTSPSVVTIDSIGTLFMLNGTPYFKNYNGIAYDLSGGGGGGGVDTVVISSTDTLFIAIDSTNNFVYLDTLPNNAEGSGSFIYGTAGDTTSPGKFYYLDATDNTWLRADTNVTIRAKAIAMDSVFKGNATRFLVQGTYRNNNWSWTPGAALFSDSLVAGEVGTGGQASPKKMQYYGQALSATVILVDIDPTIAY